MAELFEADSYMIRQKVMKILGEEFHIYSDESTVSNVEKRILNIKTDNVKIAKILNNLFLRMVSYKTGSKLRS